MLNASILKCCTTKCLIMLEIGREGDGSRRGRKKVGMSYSQVCVYIVVYFPSVLISLLVLICYKSMDLQLAIQNI